MSNLNLIVSLISDSVNGLIEIHFDNMPLAEQELANFIDEGEKINIENSYESPRQAAENFFHLEHHEIKSIEELVLLHENHSSDMVNIKAELCDKLNIRI